MKNIVKYACFDKARGMALIIALVMLFVLSVLAMGFITAANYDYLFTRKTIERMQAYYLAESGIEYAMMKQINWVNYPVAEMIEMDEGSISLQVSDPQATSFVNIVSIGRRGQSTKLLNVSFNRNGGIASWQEETQGLTESGE